MLHLTLRQLQIFEAVARAGSFSKASHDLHLTQPAVSMQVKQLEESTGFPLFEQIGKRIFLTEAGREVLRASLAITQQLSDLETRLTDLKGLRQGELTLGVVSTASYFATRLMARFRLAQPDIRITLNVVNRETLLTQLANNAIDLALMGQPPADRDLEALPLMANPLVVIAAPFHTLAGHTQIALDRLAQEPFMLREVGSGTRNATESFFENQGLKLKSAMEMNANEAIKQAVEVGLGLGVVSLHTVETEVQSGKLCILDVEGFPIARQWFRVHRRGKHFSASAQAFTDFLTAEITRQEEMAPFTAVPTVRLCLPRKTL